MALTPEIKLARKSGLGGSDAAAILGLSKWKTPLDIFMDKISDDIEEDVNTPNQEWGHRLEPVILQKFQEDKKLLIRPMHEAFKLKEHEMLWHPKHKFMFANVDGFIPAENAVIEIKTADKFLAKDWDIEGTDKIPDYYLTQCAHYAEVLGVKKVYIAVLIGGNDYRTYCYEANQRLQDLLVEREKNFWENYVLTKTCPPSQTIEDSRKRWNQSIEDSTKIATEEIEALYHDLMRTKAHIKALEAVEKEKTMQLFEFLQDTEVLLDMQSKKLCTWKSQTTNRFDTNAFKALYPELYAQFTKESSSRVLRLAKNG